MNILVGQQTFLCPEQSEVPIFSVSTDKDWKSITVIGTSAEVKAAFIDNVTYSQRYDSRRYLTPAEVTEYDTNHTAYNTENGMAYVIETIVTDLSEYCVAGDVVDTRDGNITVYMRKKTEVEISQDAYDNLMLQFIGG